MRFSKWNDMKILFDHQIFSKQIYGGASKYFCEVMKRIPTSNWETTTLFSNNEYVRNLHLFRYCNVIPGSYFNGKATFLDYLNRPYSLLRLARGNYDVFHQTDFATYYFGAVKSKKVVTTFHDMNYTLFYHQYSNGLKKRLDKLIFLQKKSVERADKIIAVSHNTKKDLVTLWNVNPEKIAVIHHGVDKTRIPNLDPAKIISNPYLLYVGERSIFKNFDRLLHAFAMVVTKYPNLKMICTGRPFTDVENKLFDSLQLKDRLVSISANERTMAQLYRDAEMFVYPSYSEGFGMPILEAMVYDCPVVVSNASCLPEVAGDAGVYFDPFNVEDLSQKIELLLSSTSLRNEVIAKGIKQLEKFSWEKSAQEHMEVYQSLL